MSNAKGSAQGTTSKVAGSQIKSAAQSRTNSMVRNQKPTVRSISARAPKSETGQAADNKQMSPTHRRCSPKSVPTNTSAADTPDRPPRIDLAHESSLISESSKMAVSLQSSACSLPELDDSNSGSQPDDLVERKTEGDKLQKRKIKFNKPRMNLVTQQRLCRLKGQPPVKTILRSASAHLKHDQNSLTSRPSQSALPVSTPRQRMIETNQVRALESLHQKLKDLQSDFMYKLRCIGPTGLSKLPGCYKFVTMVVKEECKLVVHEDDMRHLPKNLPVESVNDLKDRCRAVLDTGFMLMYEHLPNIQLAKTDAESRKLREDLRAKLQSLLNRKLLDVLNEIGDLCGTNGSCKLPEIAKLYHDIGDLRLQKQHAESKYFDSKKIHAEHLCNLQEKFQTRLNEEISYRDKQIDNLKISMLQMEDKLTEQSLNLAEKDASIQDKNETKDQLHTEMNQLRNTNKRMQQGLEDSDANLKRAHKSIKKNVERINYLELELKEARDFIVNLQKRPDAMDQGVVEKDLIINDLKTQLNNLEKHKDLLIIQVDNAVKKHAVYEELKEDYAVAMSRINDLQTQLKSSQAVIESQCRVEDQLRHQIDLGKEELQKTVLQVDQLQERAERDRQLLEVRSQMITAMQQHEKEYQNKLDQMYYQVSEKNTLISQVNNELSSKTEEFRNLFSTLSGKQLELRQQEHIIKLLEENNARNSMLRIKQEERNAILQDEITHHKRTIHALMLGPQPSDVEVDDMQE